MQKMVETGGRGQQGTHLRRAQLGVQRLLALALVVARALDLRELLGRLAELLVVQVVLERPAVLIELLVLRQLLLLVLELAEPLLDEVEHLGDLVLLVGRLLHDFERLGAAFLVHRGAGHLLEQVEAVRVLHHAQVGHLALVLGLEAQLPGRRCREWGLHWGGAVGGRVRGVGRWGLYLLDDVVGVGLGKARALEQALHLALLHAFPVEEELVLLVPHGPPQHHLVGFHGQTACGGGGGGAAKKTREKAHDNRLDTGTPRHAPSELSKTISTYAAMTLDPAPSCSRCWRSSCRNVLNLGPNSTN